MSKSTLIGIFETERGIVEGASEARLSGVEIIDAYTPYAVHGLDTAMGLKQSRLGMVCFAAGVTGLLSAMALQLGTMAIDWPMNIGGKSFQAYPALIPITFELTILFGATITVGAFFFRSKLWTGKSVTLVAERISDDRFVLSLGNGDQARTVLESAGAIEIREEGPSE